MNTKLVLVEATVYDNITEENGRQEVLIALRTQSARLAQLEAENTALKMDRGYGMYTRQGLDMEIELEPTQESQELIDALLAMAED